MPELPEVESLCRFLDDRCRGLVVATTQVVDIACLKTADPPLDALHGLAVEQVTRRGKFLCLGIGGLWLVTHLARAGWLRWHDAVPPAPARPGRGPLAFRLAFADGSGFDLTEAGTRKRLAVYVARDLMAVPGIASLGPEPLDAAFTPSVLDQILDAAKGAQLKGVLRDQHQIAGIGNAYSDEIAWTARLSPFAACGRLDPESRQRLYDAIHETLTSAISRSGDVAAAGLKAEKKTGLLVHGRTGQPCPACGTPIAEVSFADSSLQYCPTCQTGGRTLADRRLSRLLK